MPDLAHKLGIKPGHRVCLLDSPPGALDFLRLTAPPDAGFAETLASAPYDIILFWPMTLDGLAEQFAALQRQIVTNGAVWAIMPKKAFAARRGITYTWDQLQQAALISDLVDNKIASFSDQDYATRFVIRRQRR